MHNNLKFLLFLLGIIIPISLFGQGSSLDISALLNKTHAERTILLVDFYEKKLANQDSISIFSTIQQIEKAAKKAKDKDLLLETKVMRIHYFYYRNKFPKELVVNKLLALDKLAKDEKILWLQARVNNMLGNYLYFHQRDYARGFEYHERAATLMSKLTTKEFPLKPICLFQIGTIYSEFGEDRKSVNYLRRAVQSLVNGTSYYHIQNINNSLGYGYTELHKIDSADYFFKRVLKNAEAQGDSTWIGIAKGNLGYNRFFEKNYNEALPLLQAEFKQAIIDKDYPLATNALYKIAEITFQTGDISKANNLAMQSKKLAYTSGELRTLKNIYPLLIKIKAQTGESKLVEKYLDSTEIISNLLAEKFDSRILTLAQQKVQLEVIKNAEKQKELLAEKRILFRNATIIGLFVLLLIILLLWNQNKIKANNKAVKLTAQKELADQKLIAAIDRLENFKKSIVDKNKVLQKIESELELSKKELKTIRSHSAIDNINSVTLQKLQDAAILTDRDWREFVSDFEKVYQNYFKNLDENFPGLTPSEIKLMALLKLELGNKEMALILGVGTSAIRQSKSRLRKKLSLSTDTDLFELVAKL